MRGYIYENKEKKEDENNLTDKMSYYEEMIDEKINLIEYSLDVAERMIKDKTVKSNFIRISLRVSKKDIEYIEEISKLGYLDNSRKESLIKIKERVKSIELKLSGMKI